MLGDHAPDDVSQDKESHPPAAPVVKGRVPRLVQVREDTAQGVTTYTHSYTPEPILFEFRHLAKERLFSVTEVGGQPQYFRDNPTRYLVVEPYTHEGGIGFTPAVEHGRPVYLWLCREDREARRAARRWEGCT